MDSQFQQVDFGPLKQFLENDGFLIFEIGYNQGQAILELAKKENWKVEGNEIIKDLAGNDRVVVLFK